MGSMSRPAPIKTNLDFEAFLELETRSKERHEFVDGNLFVMPGGTDRHNEIAGELYSLIRRAAHRKNCKVFFTDVMIRVPSGDSFYPDIFVSCDFTEDEPRVKRRPCVIVEVLSDSTEAVDRGEKMRQYRTIPALETYILLEQEAPRAEVYAKQPDGSWRHDVLERDAILRLSQLELEILLESLYANLPEL